ncbi:MAG: FtsX-like permease family protein [Chlorobiales bacterium]|nr:FtsX-like permease family protein [Chlorobiales bacterium]
MIFQDIIRMALSSLGANKLRSFLTMLGITVGVFSVIGVMTAIRAVENSVEEGLAELGANTFQIQRDPAVLLRGPHGRRDLSNRKDIIYEEAVRFRRLMGDDAKSVGIEASEFGKQAVYAGRKTNPNLEVTGGDQYYAAANGYNIAYGRNMTPEDVLYARNVIVAGPGIQEKLFPSENPLNKQIKLAGQTYTIIGVFEKKGSVFGQSKDDFALMPITRFLMNYGPDRSLSISVQANTKQTYTATMDKSVGAMRLVRGLAPEEGNDFDIRTNEALIKSFEEIAGTIRIGAFIISFIALITAGIGIMNIMLVSVTERTKEIGIRKSIGAKKKNILTQFLIEAIFLSEVGGIIGILVGVAGGNIFAVQFKLDFIFPWDWAIIGLVVCSVIGIGFGLYPAYKASSLDPIEALRFE